MERVDFQGTDISGVLDRLPDEDRNRLPFGVVKLDTQGKILAYNMAEAEISGVRVQDVIGKNFFLEVAVCTQRPEFYGKFRDAMDNDRVLNLIFDYEFQNALYSAVHEPVKVRVHMFSSYEIGGIKIVWLMVKRVGGNKRRRADEIVDVAARGIDVAARAAADLGVPVLGNNAQQQPVGFPQQAAPILNAPPPWLSMPSAPPAPAPFPQQPMPQFAPQMMPPMQQPAGAQQAWQPQQTFAQQQAFATQQHPFAQQQQPAPQRPASNAPEIVGIDIVVRFDDV
jgi:photoactive yellow protein